MKDKREMFLSYIKANVIDKIDLISKKNKNISRKE